MSRIRENVVMESWELTKIVCDHCGKETDITPQCHYDKTYTIQHQHFAWGNDSGDSARTVDGCSYDCFIKNIAKILKEETEESLIINDMSREVWQHIINDILPEEVL